MEQSDIPLIDCIMPVSRGPIPVSDHLGSLIALHYVVIEFGSGHVSRTH